MTDPIRWSGDGQVCYIGKAWGTQIIDGEVKPVIIGTEEEVLKQHPIYAERTTTPTKRIRAGVTPPKR